MNNASKFCPNKPRLLTCYFELFPLQKKKLGCREVFMWAGPQQSCKYCAAKWVYSKGTTTEPLLISSGGFSCA